jgi:hypothetical protein
MGNILIRSEKNTNGENVEMNQKGLTCGGWVFTGKKWHTERLGSSPREKCMSRKRSI